MRLGCPECLRLGFSAKTLASCWRNTRQEVFCRWHGGSNVQYAAGSRQEVCENEAGSLQNRRASCRRQGKVCKNAILRPKLSLEPREFSQICILEGQI